MKIGDFVIDVVKKDIKNLHLGVYPPDGRVRIASSDKLSDDTIRLFAISKLGWIKRKQAQFQAQPRQSPKEYVSGESHYFQGDRYLLNVIYHRSAPKVVIRNKTSRRIFESLSNDSFLLTKANTMQYQTEQWLHSTWVKDTRLYNLELCQDLFGHWIVRRNWNSKPRRGFGRSNYTLCPDLETALVLFDKQQQRRKKHGYTPVQVSSRKLRSYLN